MLSALMGYVQKWIIILLGIFQYRNLHCNAATKELGLGHLNLVEA